MRRLIFVFIVDFHERAYQISVRNWNVPFVVAYAETKVNPFQRNTEKRIGLWRYILSNSTRHDILILWLVKTRFKLNKIRRGDYSQNSISIFIYPDMDLRFLLKVSRSVPAAEKAISRTIMIISSRFDKGGDGPNSRE